MATIPDPIAAHHRTVLHAQVRAVRSVRRAWREVSPEWISQSWTHLIPIAAAAVAEGQRVAATSAVMAGALALPETGGWEPPTDFVDPGAFAGRASDQRDLDGLLYSPAVRAKRLISGGLPAQAALVSAGLQLETLVRTAVSDSGRQAAGVAIAARPKTGYVRMTAPPSCPDCIILAGRFYRWNAGFQRHPKCDCVHVPTVVTDTAEAHAHGLIDDPYELFRRLSEDEQDAMFGKASAQAVRDGADIFQVVNSKRGRTRSGAFTTDGMGKHGHARGILKPGQRRATPEQIYKWAGNSRSKAVDLLREHGYLLDGGQNPAGVLRGQREGFGQYGRGGARNAASEAVRRALETGVRDGSPYTMTAAERRLYEAERDWLMVLDGQNPWSSAAVEQRGGAKIGSQGQPLTPEISAQVEARYIAAVQTKGEALSMRAALRAARRAK